MKFVRSLAAGILFSATLAVAQPPVAEHGRLSVQGAHIVDSTGTPYQMRGMSLFWSNFVSKYWNANAVKWLVDDWKISLIRAAVGVEGTGAWIRDTAKNNARLDAVVQAAIDNGIYVLIDWHDHNASNHPDSAIAFFERAARLYGEHPNVIYEIWNEPLKVSWGNVVKPYAEQVVSAIRAIDPDNLIIVGTPSWSQNVDSAAANPLEATNVAYSLHFYSATHRAWLRDRVRVAVDSGLPIMVTEWGTSKSSGNDTIDLGESTKWLDYLDSNSISWANWSVVDKEETSAALQPNANRNGGWTEEDLTPSGGWVRARLRTQAGFPTDPPRLEPLVDTFAVPGRIDASKLLAMSGIITGPTLDSADELGIGSIDSADWSEWQLDVEKAGTYHLLARVASNSPSGARIVIRSGNEVVGGLAVPFTGGWETWTTIDTTVELPAGLQVLRFSYEGTNFDGLLSLNWIDLVVPGTSVGPRSASPSFDAVRKEFSSSTGSWELSVHTPVGAMIRSSRGTGPRASLDVSGLPHGLVVVRFRDGSQVSTRRILAP